MTTSQLLNVAVTGEVLFDSSVWSLATLTAPAPAIPYRELTITDGPGQPGTVGVETPELMTGTVNIGGGVGPLAFDRSLVAGAVDADVWASYQGQTRMGYLDGTEGLGLPSGGELGDSFYFSLFNSFGRYEPGVVPVLLPGAPGEVFSRGADSSLGFDIHTNYSSPDGVLHQMFAAGPPTAFSWVDPNPGLCGIDFSSCTDGFLSFNASFNHQTALLVWGPTAAESLGTTYSGRMVLNRVDLRPAVVPEPGTLALLGIGLVGVAMRLRRPARSGHSDAAGRRRDRMRSS